MRIYDEHADIDFSRIVSMHILFAYGKLCQILETHFMNKRKKHNFLDSLISEQNVTQHYA